MVIWKSKKQKVVAQSSVEVEYRGMAHGVCELLWLKNLLRDLGFKLKSIMQLYCDNKTGVEPTLEFVLTKKDITGTGAPATLLVFNNEVGFSKENIDSICSVGRSTKKGKRRQGFIGEKGIN